MAKLVTSDQREQINMVEQVLKHDGTPLVNAGGICKSFAALTVLGGIALSAPHLGPASADVPDHAKGNAGLQVQLLRFWPK